MVSWAGDHFSGPRPSTTKDAEMYFRIADVLQATRSAGVAAPTVIDYNVSIDGSFYTAEIICFESAPRITFRVKKRSTFRTEVVYDFHSDLTRTWICGNVDGHQTRDDVEVANKVLRAMEEATRNRM